MRKNINLFKLDNYLEAADKGRLTKTFSRSKKYVSFKYSLSTTFERDWDYITLTSRGHVWDLDTGKCVAAPFDKFFNYEELSPSVDGTFKNDPILKEFVSRWDIHQLNTVTPWDKLDGSMGVIWLDSANNVCVNTPGSFSSEQSRWAVDWLEKNEVVENNIRDLLLNTGWHSLCVEIIYWGNKVVVPYDKTQYGIHLTGATINPNEYWAKKFESDMMDVCDQQVNTPKQYTLWGRWANPETLQYLADHIGIPCARVFKDDPATLIEKARSEGTGESCEGWVFQIPTGSRIKIKCKDYLVLHKIKTNIHSNRILDILVQNGCDKDISFSGDVNNLPEQWLAASNAIRDWLMIIDEEYREPYESLVEDLNNNIKFLIDNSTKVVNIAHKVGIHTAGDLARAVNSGSITLPKNLHVGAPCTLIKSGVININITNMFKKLKKESNM